MVIYGWARNSACTASMVLTTSSGTHRRARSFLPTGSSACSLHRTGHYGSVPSRAWRVGRTGSSRSIRNWRNTTFSIFSKIVRELSGPAETRLKPVGSARFEVTVFNGLETMAFLVAAPSVYIKTAREIFGPESRTDSGAGILVPQSFTHSPASLMASRL